MEILSISAVPPKDASNLIGFLEEMLSGQKFDVLSFSNIIPTLSIRCSIKADELHLDKLVAMVWIPAAFSPYSYLRLSATFFAFMIFITIVSNM